MVDITIKVLKQLIENIPDDYTIKHEDAIDKYIKTAKIEMDVENGCVIFK